MKIFASLLLAAAFFVPCAAQTNGVPMGLVRRTFYLKVGNMTGTGFAVDYNNKHYLLTARHIIKTLPKQAAKIQIFRTESWKDFTVNILTPKNEEVDIAILVSDESFASAEDASFGELTMENLNVGGEVYFLGYPHGLHSLMGTEYIPFVKKGVMSAVDASDETAIILYVDGFNNEGFSGGPVVFFDTTKKVWKIAGVVKGFVQEAAKVKVKKEEVDTNTLVNSGILIAYNIKHALEAIDPQKF